MQTGRCLLEASARVVHLVALLATLCQANGCAWCLLASLPAFFLSLPLINHNIHGSLWIESQEL